MKFFNHERRISICFGGNGRCKKPVTVIELDNLNNEAFSLDRFFCQIHRHSVAVTARTRVRINENIHSLLFDDEESWILELTGIRK